MPLDAILSPPWRESFTGFDGCEWVRDFVLTDGSVCAVFASGDSAMAAVLSDGRTMTAKEFEADPDALMDQTGADDMGYAILFFVAGPNKVKGGNPRLRARFQSKDLDEIKKACCAFW
jgi:hypothetical protein